MDCALDIIQTVCVCVYVCVCVCACIITFKDALHTLLLIVTIALEVFFILKNAETLIDGGGGGGGVVGRYLNNHTIDGH